jgi:hypothetical protein
MDDNPEIEDRESGPDEDVVVFTAEFCVIYGGCTYCKGFATAEQLRSRSKPGLLPADIPDNQVVFCTHWCHRTDTMIS